MAIAAGRSEVCHARHQPVIQRGDPGRSAIDMTPPPPKKKEALARIQCGF